MCAVYAKRAGAPNILESRTMKFLIVDDDPIILQLIKAVLEDGGHSVKCYESSVQALHDIPLERPDCVIASTS